MLRFVCFPRLRLDHFDGLIPFDFKTEPTDSNSKYLGESLAFVKHTAPTPTSCICYVWLRLPFPVNLVSLELTYFCSGLLFAAVVQRRVWDYALTVTLVHVAVTSLGEQQPDKTPRHLKNGPQTAGCVSVAVMLEFPMVWQWWLALGKSSHCVHRCPLNVTFKPFSGACRQRLVPDDLQRSADCLLHLPERADLRLLQHLLTNFISHVNYGVCL